MRLLERNHSTQSLCTAGDSASVGRCRAQSFTYIMLSNYCRHALLLTAAAAAAAAAADNPINTTGSQQ